MATSKVQGCHCYYNITILGYGTLFRLLSQHVDTNHEGTGSSHCWIFSHTQSHEAWVEVKKINCLEYDKTAFLLYISQKCSAPLYFNTGTY